MFVVNVFKLPVHVVTYCSEVFHYTWFVVVVAGEQARIYRAGGWVEFNRVNGKYCSTHPLQFVYSCCFFTVCTLLNGAVCI